MFTEQPTPPHSVADVQVLRANGAVSQASLLLPTSSPVSNRVATPETLPKPEPGSATTIAPPGVKPDPSPAIAPVAQPATTPPSSSAPDAVKVQRRQEVEQSLLELTRKARDQQREQQAQQAAADAAKYIEAGELEAAEKAVNNSALPANIRAALLKKLQAQQAKQGNKAIAAKKPGTTNSSNVLVSQPGTSSARDYSTAPIVPMSEAQLRLKFGQLIGRNLNFSFPLSISAPITSLFGWRIHPISGSPRFHRGIDFGAPEGTPIIAAKMGRVELADAMDGYGLAVILRHGTTQQTLYGHMSQIYVKPGEVVKKGQLLGLVGSTGNSAGPHLHFEVHELTSEGWTALDPAIALNGAIALAQNAPLLRGSSTKPNSFNLAMSGLLDINAPLQTLPSMTWGNTLLSSLRGASASVGNSATGLEFPLSWLPPALPELSWLLSPLVENLLTGEFIFPLNGFDDQPSIITFSSIPALSQPSQPVAFKPQASPPIPGKMRVATTKPLAGLTIAEQTPGAVRLKALQTPVVTRDRAPASVPLTWQQHAQHLQSKQRMKPLDGG